MEITDDLFTLPVSILVSTNTQSIMLHKVKQSH